jgi:hypothetical protein
MKKDKMEKFIVENRSSFDDLEPSASVWEGVRINEPVRKNYRWLKISMQAAAAVLLFVVAYYFHDFMQGDIRKYGVAVKPNQKLEIKNQKIIEKKTNKQVSTVKLVAENSENKTKKIYIKHKDILKSQMNYENKEITEAGAYYAEIIKKKKAEIFNCTADNPDVKKEINNEFGQLDKAFKDLQNDLKENVDNSQVIDAMIQNYRMKLEVLEYMKNHVCTADLK